MLRRDFIMTPRFAGIVFSLVTFTIFAVQDGISRYLGAHYPPIFITMLRYWAFAVFVIVMALRSPGGLRAAASTPRPVLQVARGVILALQIVVAIFCFTHVGLAHTHSIFASTPLIVAALSVPVLGERVGWRRWLAIGAGMIGILIVVNPFTSEWEPLLPLTFVGAFLLSTYSLLTRLASRTDTAMTSFFYTGIAGAAVMTMIGPFFYTTMTAADSLWMLALCATGIAGHYCLIRAFELANAATVQPFAYYQLVLASLIGVLVFNETLTSNMMIGALVVIGAGAFTIWREELAARKALRAAADRINTA